MKISKDITKIQCDIWKTDGHLYKKQSVIDGRFIIALIRFEANNKNMIVVLYC